MRIRTSEQESVDVTKDYKSLLKDVSLVTGLPINRIIIEEHPCGEDCIFDSITGKWYSYISEYFEERYEYIE